VTARLTVQSREPIRHLATDDFSPMRGQRAVTEAIGGKGASNRGQGSSDGGAKKGPQLYQGKLRADGTRESGQVEKLFAEATTVVR
jgi:hypothetical protein